MTVFIRDALGYSIASACALAVDVAVLTTLVQYCSWWYLAAAPVSFLTGVVVTYALSVTFVFKHRRRHDRRLEFTRFAVIGVMGLGINSGIMFLSVSCIGLYYLAAKGVAAVFTFGFNFIARRQLFLARASV